jgi:hypothetical protein
MSPVSCPTRPTGEVQSRLQPEGDLLVAGFGSSCHDSYHECKKLPSLSECKKLSYSKISSEFNKFTFDWNVTEFQFSGNNFFIRQFLVLCSLLMCGWRIAGGQESRESLILHYSQRIVELDMFLLFCWLIKRKLRFVVNQKKNFFEMAAAVSKSF